MAELEILVKVWVILLGILTLSDVQANRLKTLTVSGSLKEKYGMPSAREINVEQKSDGLNTVFSSYKSLHHQKREVGENSNITTKVSLLKIVYKTAN